MFITPPEKTWVPAVIKEYLGHRSYKVQTVDGVVYRRTRLHLKPYKSQGNRLKKPAQQLPGNKPVQDLTEIDTHQSNLTCEEVQMQMQNEHGNDIWTMSLDI